MAPRSSTINIVLILLVYYCYYYYYEGTVIRTQYGVET